MGRLVELYTYRLFDIEHMTNIPYHLNIVPTNFRCDGLAEWATEIGMNPANPKQEDGFYSTNNNRFMFFLEPIMMTKAPVDTIATPDKPQLSQSDNQIEIKFPLVSGAWSKALYILFKNDTDNSYNAEAIYCGSDRSYTDTLTEDMQGRYYYYLKIGERTASCDDTNTDFSNFSKPSSINNTVWIASYFNTDAEGWTITGDAQSGSSTPTYVSVYIQAVDDVSGANWYFNAPSKFLGDLSSFYGGSFYFELAQNRIDRPSSIGNNVIIRSNIRTIRYSVYKYPQTSFTPFEVPLGEEGWEDTNNQHLTAEEFKSILSSVNSISIRGEYRSGPDTGSLDNVVLSPKIP